MRFIDEYFKVLALFMVGFIIAIPVIICWHYSWLTVTIIMIAAPPVIASIVVLIQTFKGNL
jgi:hypothetical protein